MSPNVLVKLRLIIIFGLFFWIFCTSYSKKCPSKYKRFSKTHTYCLKPNPKCEIRFSGVTKRDKSRILRYHNAFRNITAMGKESRAKGGSLPAAGDMLQMVWDKELAAIAQKWTDNCEFKHDCDECRMVPNFPVGQNIAIYITDCPKENCTKKQEKYINKPDWAHTITRLYDEVLDYSSSWFKSKEVSKETGHFTQIVWSTSWRVGCGYTSYREGDKFNRFYACNYGPPGNFPNYSLYTEGKHCSSCPKNTCCGNTCKKKQHYPGLCKLRNPNKAPIYSRETSKFIFYCDSDRKTKDCARKSNGTNKWRVYNSLSGPYIYTKLKGGRKSTLTFEKEVKPTQSKFCVQLKYRKNPSKAGNKDTSSASLHASYEGHSSSDPLNETSFVFTFFKVTLKWNKPTKIGINFSVPSGKKSHIFDLKEILAYDGQCESKDL